MSEPETEGNKSEEAEPWYETPLKAGGLVHTGVEAVEAGLAHGSDLASTASSFAGEAAEAGGTGLGNFVAPLALASGVNEMVNGKTVTDQVGGGLEAASGAIGTAGLAGAGVSAVGNSVAAAGVAGELGAASGIGMEAGAALSSAGGAMSGAAAAAAPVAAVAGAGAAGLAVGTGMAHAADSDYTRTGVWGTDADTGQNRSAMDAAANWGTDYDREHGVAPGDWSVGGAARAAVGGIGAGIAGTVQAGYNASGLGSAVDSGVSTVQGWFGGADDAVKRAYGVPGS